MDRRTTLKILLAAGALPPSLGACSRPSDSRGPGPEAPPRDADAPMPVLFLAHGSPLLLADAPWVAELAAWSKALPRPRSILMLSAHWTSAPARIGATTTAPLVYDFSGFPPEHYRVTYPSPGAPRLASRVRELLTGKGGSSEDPRRGLDHGAYVPLVAMYPAADIPVLQLSLPSLDPAELFALGQALGPLRREGVLIVGSGFLTHNMRALDMRPNAAPPGWASDFDAWAAEVIQRQDIDALLAYRSRAPGVSLALPTHEHFAPVIMALGAAQEARGAVTFPITGFMAGSFTRRSVQIG